MLSTLASWTTAVWGSMVKGLRSALTERATLIQTITLPINYLVLLSLFVLSGSNAPTAVVALDSGPAAQALIRAMQAAHSFHLLRESTAQAQQQWHAGTLVAIVTIPANFDTAVAQGRPVQVGLQLNNLNEDLTDDVRRAMGLSISTFYAHYVPHRVPIVMQEQDQYAHDTGYIPFLALSIMVIALLVSGILQAGMATAREWERATVKEWLLAPVPRWTMLLGTMLAALLVSVPSVVVVLLVVVVVVGGWPVNAAVVIGTSLLALFCFVAVGVALGTLVKERGTLTILTRALVVPLFFLSGVFGPISFSTPAVQWLARLFPVHYAIVLEQYGFKQFVMNPLAPLVNATILAGFALLALIGASLALRFSRVNH